MLQAGTETLIRFLGGTFLFTLLAGFIVFFVILHKKSQRRHLLEKKLLEATFKEESLKTQLEIQEQTFQNISQEIHDNIGQILTLAKLNLNTIESGLPEITTGKIQRTKELVSKAIVDLRDLSKSLNTELIQEIGLHEIIQREILLVSKSGEYETDFTLEGDPFRFDKQKELILFRIFQELLQNIIKHAKPKKVKVQIQYEPEAFSLTVSDDGEGFDATKLSTEHRFGSGIRNMQNRAALIGASLRVNSARGSGTTVSIQLPIESPTTN